MSLLQEALVALLAIWSSLATLLALYLRDENQRLRQMMEVDKYYIDILLAAIKKVKEDSE